MVAQARSSGDNGPPCEKVPYGSSNNELAESYSDDCTLSERLIRGESEAVAEFGKRFSSVLASIRAANPGCHIPLVTLLPHLGFAIGSGYLAWIENTSLSLRAYLETVHLGDLFLVASCLQNDQAAWQRLQEIVDAQVAARLRRTWASRVSPQMIEQVVSDLAGHCFQKAKKGANADKQRLGSYRGQASLPTWLCAIASKVLLDSLRSVKNTRTEFVREVTASRASIQPETGFLIKESEQHGINFLQRLCEVLRNTLEGMPARRRMAVVSHWVYGDSPSQVADRMRVSRPRISELLTEARQQFRNATDTLCQEIARESHRSLDQIQNHLEDELGSILRLGFAKNAECCTPLF